DRFHESPNQFHVDEMCVSGVEILTFLHQNELHRKIFLCYGEPFYRIQRENTATRTKEMGPWPSTLQWSGPPRPNNRNLRCLSSRTSPHRPSFLRSANHPLAHGLVPATAICANLRHAFCRAFARATPLRRPIAPLPHLLRAQKRAYARTARGLSW